MSPTNPTNVFNPKYWALEMKKGFKIAHLRVAHQLPLERRVNLNQDKGFERYRTTDENRQERRSIPSQRKGHRTKKQFSVFLLANSIKGGKTFDSVGLVRLLHAKIKWSKGWRSPPRNYFFVKVDLKTWMKR